MLGLIGKYDSDSADDSPADISLSKKQESKPHSIGGVKKPLSNSASNPLFQNYDSDDSDSSHNSIQQLPFVTGVIDIVQPPKGRNLKTSASIANSASNQYLAMRLIPPEPTGRPDPVLQEKIIKYLNTGKSFNSTLQGKKEFHNPYILNKITQIYKIDQRGSNYLTDIYDPKEWLNHDFERIARKQEQTLRDRAISEPNLAPQPPASSKTLPSGATSRWDSGPLLKKPKPGSQGAMQHALQIANQLKASLSGGAIDAAAAASKKEAARTAKKN